VNFLQPFVPFRIRQQRLRVIILLAALALRGHSLRRIETAVKRMELSHLASLPDGQPLNFEITVLEAKDA
jgi:hypothetical protein